MSVFKKTYAKPLPEGAETSSKGVVCWKDAHGHKRKGRLTADGCGVLVESGIWTATYRDGRGRLVTCSTRCKTRDGALRKLAEYEATAEKVRCGLITATEASTIEWQALSLSRHIADYQEHLRGKGVTPTHEKEQARCLTALADACNFDRLADVERTAFERWLGKEREAGRGARSMNAYREALMGLCNWCVRAGRLAVNPIVGVPKANERADRKHLRRALNEAEMDALLDAARRDRKSTRLNSSHR
jgi:integrase